MKKTLSFLTMVFAMNVIIAQPPKGSTIVTPGDAKTLKNLVITPSKPLPGATITIRYNPINTTLSGVKNFDATGYLLDGEVTIAVEIPLIEEKGVYVGSFRSNATTRAVFVSFNSNESFNNRLVDNNDDNGYFTAMYDGSGREVIGANNALASGFLKYYMLWGMKQNVEMAAALNKKEFASPASRGKLYNEYFSYLGQTGDKADIVLLKKELQKQLKKTSLNESDMTKVKDFYKNLLKDAVKSDAVYASIKKKFPLGMWKLYVFDSEQDLKKKDAMFRQLLSAYPASKEYRQLIHFMAGVLAQTHAQAGDYDKMEPYLKYFKDKSSVGSFYNTYAARLSGGQVAAMPIDVAKGLEFSRKALSYMEDEIKSQESRPSQLTPKQYWKKLNSTYHAYLHINAILLYHNNEAEKAYGLMKQAIEVFEGNNVYMNANFALVTGKVKGAAEAQKVLEEFISAGKANPAMKDQLKTIYLKSNTPEQFTQYMAQLEKAAFNKLKAQLAKSMISIPAPVFNLKNLSGENVTLASLKGKVVIVDFWSTWCGPCKASFPAMQKIVQKYKKNPDVVFLFIDTWESGEERKSDVVGFLEKNKYDFNVLYDEARQGSASDFIVVSDFKVSGIPTKFVIDKDSNIRFRSSGYNGAEDGLINELTAMIELANSTAGSK